MGWGKYDGDWTRTPTEAQESKFENAFKQLGLKEGMHILDIGCGFGDWLAWLRDAKKVTGLGIELTEAHANAARLQGLEIFSGPWQYYAASTEFEKKYAGKFDAVTCFDNGEHWMEPAHVMDGAMFGKVYRRAFLFFHKCTNPKSECKSLYISCLHQNRPNDRSFYEMFNIYLLTARYGGLYPGKLPWSSMKARSPPEYIIDYEVDFIEDYRHQAFTKCGFQMQPGCIFSLTYILSIPVFLMAYPHFEWTVWDHYRHENSWMWHIGGLSKKISPNVITSLMVQVYRHQDVPVTLTKDWVKVGNKKTN